MAKKKTNQKDSESKTSDSQVLEKDLNEEKANSEGNQEEEELNEVEKLQKELDEYKDKYIRLYSEFENFRRRTNKEKYEIIHTANERLIVDFLPIVDDFERAEKSFSETKDVDAIKKGIDLIYNKLIKTLESTGAKKMNSKGESFDAEKHEAITQIPAPEKKLKGKIVDVIEEGYILKEKVIRYAKVVIGQ